MKTRLIPIALFAIVLVLTACANLLMPHDVEIPLARLQDAISQRFPFNNRMLELLDIHLTNPRVTLQPGTNRIMTSLDAAVSPPFMKKSWNGNFAISGQLRFDPARNAILLGEPRVETFNVNGLDPLYANQIGRVGRILAEELLKDMPVYTFRPEELRRAGATFNPTKITTRSDALVVTFEPVR